MRYMAVGDRCAVHLQDIGLPMKDEEMVKRLRQLGLIEVRVDIVSIARACIGQSRYRLGSNPNEAPGIVDCSSFMKWLYAQRGIWIPRFSVQQYLEGMAYSEAERKAGDLAFTHGRQDFYHDEVPEGIGHVGLCTNEGTVIHATQEGVVESSYASFVRKEAFGIRRIVLSESVQTFITTSQCVESSDDFRWIILKHSE